MESSLAPPVVAGSISGERRLPDWIRVRPPRGDYGRVKGILDSYALSTVCREAHCPNLSECWSEGTATLMLLGSECSRRCAFCAVRTHWSRGAVDATEPQRVAAAVREWGLRYLVLTQVCRDDLGDGGATILAETVRKVREESPTTRVELLIGDLGSNVEALSSLLRTPPDVLAHNIETVRRLSPSIRDRRASYEGSLRLLRQLREDGSSNLITKSSIMLGVGETDAEVNDTLHDLRSAGVDLVTLGQYLRPGPQNWPVSRYATPDEFDAWKERAKRLGFAGVEAGPLVRSSYHAEALYTAAIDSRAR
jgi:lipoyl synthase